MELPKNITQIGESDRHCKVYAEDYVVSYMKQLNQQCAGRNITVALYGIRKEEDGVAYVFFYGAARIGTMQREVRHLSQAQNQEIEKLRKRFFPDYQFMGYGILSGEMVDGFYICEQGTCRYINGYACFYEKNDRMLAYMLDSRKEEVPTEVVESEKYEAIRKRQEERRAQYRESIADSSFKTARNESGKTAKETVAKRTGNRDVRPVRPFVPLRVMKTAAVGMFLVLCVLGIAALNDLGDVKDIQAAARQLIAQFAEQKLPDDQSVNGDAVGGEQKDTLVTQDKLTEVIIEENNVSRHTEESKGKETEASSSSGQALQPAQPSQEVQPSQPTQPSQAVQPSQPAQPSEPAKPSQEASAPVTYTSYTIRKGDTLSAISVRHYGTDARVKAICDLNQIENPDDIYFGQKILLP